MKAFAKCVFSLYLPGCGGVQSCLRKIHWYGVLLLTHAKLFAQSSHVISGESAITSSLSIVQLRWQENLSNIMRVTKKVPMKAHEEQVCG